MRHQIEVSSLLLSDQTQSETGQGEHKHMSVVMSRFEQSTPPGARVLMEEIKKQKSGRLKREVREQETEKGGEEEEKGVSARELRKKLEQDSIPQFPRHIAKEDRWAESHSISQEQLSTSQGL